MSPKPPIPTKVGESTGELFEFDPTPDKCVEAEQELKRALDRLLILVGRKEAVRCATGWVEMMAC